MVSEVGQGMCLEHDVRKESRNVAGTWCQKRVPGCEWNMMSEDG